MDQRVSGGAGAGGFSAGASEFSDATDHPSTTTISTIAVQAGKAKIVLAILRVSLHTLVLVVPVCEGQCVCVLNKYVTIMSSIFFFQKVLFVCAYIFTLFYFNFFWLVRD